MKQLSILFPFLAIYTTCLGQQADTASIPMKEVNVRGFKTITGMGHMSEVHDGIIYSGQKNEVLLTDSLDANTAQDNPRQVLGRVPGANYSETEGNGFPSNGIGFRGLNPTQSIETNTRQNGYNIAGDIYGYPESYYLTPLEATERIEVVRGASALQFGPQFGGVVNYIIRSAPADKPLVVNTEETIGSDALMNTFTSVGGAWKKWSYYTFVKYEYAQGWRDNAQMQEVTGFARLGYQVNDRWTVGVEYSLMRNLLHMPGGLDDAGFNQDPQQSWRARNWLVTPWNIAALTSEYRVSDKTLVTFKSAVNISSRSIVWRNEDGGPETPDSVSTATGSYVPREVEHEYFRNSTTELRLLSHYAINARSQTIAAGVRFFYGWMERQEGGLGSEGSGPDFTNYNPGNSFDNSLIFTTLNVAPFIENTFHIGDKLSVTPGFRWEYLRSTASGHVLDSTGAYAIPVNEQKPRSIPLAGIAFQYATSRTTNAYANVTQAYTPISYSFLYPMGLDVDAAIDPHLKDIDGYNADLGWRGHVHNYLTFDVSAWYMAHNHNIAIETRGSGANTTFYETNVGDAIHRGIEAYAEVNVVKLFHGHFKGGNISFFNSFAWDKANYANGLYKGNTAEYAPAIIDRFGLTWQLHRFSATWLCSYTAQSFSDANNTVYSPDAEVGIIPSYTVMDLSATWKIKNYRLKAGFNNLADTHYFTFRTIEYPGPGIIPSAGRTFYVGFGATF